MNAKLPAKDDTISGPGNPPTHISIRLPMTVCDWIWSMYPDEPTISSAVQRYLKDKYNGLRPEDGSV